MDDAEILWTACAEVLREQVSEAVWLTSFNGARPLRLHDGALVLGVPSSVVRERIEGRYLTLVKSALVDAGGADLDLRIEVHTDVASEADLPILRELDAFHSPLAPPVDELVKPVDNESGGSLPVNPRYTFEAFVTGTSNRFAHAAALSVAETPARSYNPLFIYGDAGLGKTHLLQAIAHYVNENYPAFTVRYVSTETFLNQFVDAIRTNSPADFKKRYREVDVLLRRRHPVHRRSRRSSRKSSSTPSTPSTRPTGRSCCRRIVRPTPSRRSRTGSAAGSRWASSPTSNPPDLETRLAILHKKAETETVVPPPDVLEFIATNITNNIRELEGALIRVCAYASLTKEELSVDLAERVLADILTDNQPRPITPAVILDATSEMFGFSIEEIQGKSRRRPLVTARQVGMYVFRELTDLSYPAIAREFGGRDHTTVIHAVEKIGALMKERRQIYDQVTELTQTIRSGG